MDTETKRIVTWGQALDLTSCLLNRIEDRGPKLPICLWPIPRGGCHVAGIVLGMGKSWRAMVVDHPSTADLALDDVIDSGRTAERIKEKYGLDTVALIDKRRIVSEDRAWVVFPWEMRDGVERDREDLVVRQIEMIGDNPSRDGLAETPARVVRAWGELYEGYNYTAEQLRTLLKPFRWEHPVQPITVRNIPFHSTCEHHMMPFSGIVEVTYVPIDSIIGLSKIPRVVNLLARRLQVQERLTHQIAELIASVSAGCSVEIRARHSCLEHRGHRGHGIEMVTRASYGETT